LQITKTHQSSTSDLCGNDGTYKDAKSIDKDNKEESKRNKKKGIMDFSSSYPPYTVRRSRFKKRFLKMAPAPPEKPLHQESEPFWVEPEPSQTGP
jgi:hypothetical protein